MKLQAPADCRSVSIEGFATMVDDKGCVDVDAASAEALIAHGFVLLGDHSLSRGSAFSADLSRLSRRELFHLLKKHNVSVALPITNDALRALAKDALSQPDERGRQT